MHMRGREKKTGWITDHHEPETRGENQALRKRQNEREAVTERERERRRRGVLAGLTAAHSSSMLEETKCWLAQDRPHKSPSIRHTTYCLLHSA